MDGIVSNIVIKTEPLDECDNEKMSSSPPWAPEEVHIKSEPFHETNLDTNVKAEPLENHSTSNNTIECHIETVSIKLEPGEDEEVYSNTVVKKKKRVSKPKDDDDEDYTPKKKKSKNNKGEIVKPTYRGKSNKAASMMYSEEVTRHIEIVTISEAERRAERARAEAARSHMPHRCAACALGFVVRRAYLAHMRVHDPESGSHECPLCHSFLKSEAMLYRHKLRHYRRYRCALCRDLHKDKDSAASHVMTLHARQAFRCDHCDTHFKRPQYLHRHMQQHHTKALTLECPECKRVFHERGRYRSHVRSHNEEVRINSQYTTVICEICSRGFKNKAGLRRHLFSCHDDDLLQTQYKQTNNETLLSTSEQCPHCPRVLVTRAMLRRHLRRMHSDRTKKYQCDYCQRLYLTKGEVRAHIMWSHAGARGGHACARCERVFRTPARLRAHAARDHRAQPPPRDHACHHCGKAFANKQILKRHMRVHSDEMYPCKECGMLFKTEPYVKMHYKLKHLNMTRAQIKDQIQKRKAESINLFKPTIGQLQNVTSESNTKLHFKIHTDVTQQSRYENVNSTNNSNNFAEIDPVSMPETDQMEFQTASKNVRKTKGRKKLKEKNELGEINTPLFETFIDIQRDIED